MKIGLGIITYNRLPCLKQCVESIYKTDSIKLSKIVIADDFSTDGTRNWLKQQKGRILPILGNINVGIARNSNRVLKCLQDVDYGFLINDDIYFKNPGWVDYYVSAMRNTPYKHFCYMGGRVGPGYGKIDLVNNFEVSHHHLVMGSCLTFTKEVLQTIGGFDSRFTKYGLEHVDWTERASLAGLTREFDIYGNKDGLKVVDLANSYEYIGDIPFDSVFDQLTKLRYYQEAMRLSEEIRTEVRTHPRNLLRPFITEET